MLAGWPASPVSPQAGLEGGLLPYPLSPPPPPRTNARRVPATCCHLPSLPLPPFQRLLRDTCLRLPHQDAPLSLPSFSLPLPLLSPHQRLLRDTCLRLNPTWTPLFWNDTAIRYFVQEKYPQYFPVSQLYAVWAIGLIG